jgi:hypothetical protein
MLEDIFGFNKMVRYHKNVRQYLDQSFETKWIARGSVNLWPPRSADLTPLDFFLWGQLKKKCTKHQLKILKTPESIKDLQNRIVPACRSLTPEILSRVSTRTAICRRNGGRHFEHLLRCF